MEAPEVAAVFDEIARLLAFKGEDRFKIQAYVRAARTLRDLDEPLVTLIEQDRLRDLPGVGPVLAGKIAQIIETGTVPLHERLRGEIPAGIRELLAIPGLGPKRVRAAVESLGVTSVQDLEREATGGRLSTVPGFGARTVKRLLEHLSGARGVGD